MKKRIALIVAAALAATTVMTGCGSGRYGSGRYSGGTCGRRQGAGGTGE